MTQVATALTIAGSDCSGGAGIQADLKTMEAHGVYGMSALTALTAQNTLGVTAIHSIPPDFLAAQLDAIFTDIFPQAVKIGMVSQRALVEVIGDKLVEYGARNIVVDPVMVSTSGSRLMEDEAMLTLRRRLFPLCAVLTPNIPEAQALTGRSISSPRELEEACRQMGESFGCAVLGKGGHFWMEPNMPTDASEEANDCLWLEGEIHWITGKRIPTRNTHGTGCTLSSAIASNLALGLPLLPAIQAAKAYLTRALSASLDLGQGPGPLQHRC